MNRYLPFLYQLILIIVILVAYRNTLNSPFLLDDVRNIVQNQYIRIDSLNVASLEKVLSGSHPMKTRPVAYFSFSLNYLLGGLNPLGFHMFNILIHVCTALILLRLINWYARKEEYFTDNAFLFSFIVVLIWAVNPIQTSSVTYIVQRMTSLCTFFFTASLLSYLTARDLFLRPEKTKYQVRSVFFFIGAFFLWIMAMLTKEIAVILPILIILHELFFYDELSWQRIAQKKKIYLLFVLVPIIFCLLYFGSLVLWNSIADGYASRDFTLVERLLTQPRAVVRYMTLFLLPLPSHLTLYKDYQVSRSFFDPVSTILSMSGILILVVGSCALARKYKLICFGFLWTLLCLVVESSIIPLELFFEHRFYLPSIGFSLAIVALFTRSFNFFCHNRYIGFVLWLTVICVLTWGSYKRNSDFETELSFSLDAVKKSPKLVRAVNNLASAYIHTGDMESGKVVLERAIKLQPDNLLLLANLFGLSVDMGQNRQAENYLHRLKQSINKGNIQCEFNSSVHMVAEILAERGRFGDAVFMLESVYECYKNDIYYDNLALCYLQVGKYKQAIKNFNKALEGDSQDPFILYSLAKAYFLANDNENAVNILNKLKVINPPIELKQHIEKLENKLDMK